MTPDRWRHIESLFHEAADLPGKQRSAFLEKACAGDPLLREQVDALLAADEQPAPVLDASPNMLAAGPPTDEPMTWTAGPYRLLEEIGHGGMGSVYLAERADGEFEKRVALKLVKRGMDTDEILRRFRYERQILASLEHPHIARFYDGGLTDDGRPYLVMEYVDGQPIDTYCDEHRLGVDQRLNLFRTACEAVQHAHRNLVVHRDLKPSNVLITKDGQVKLLDFGIAKLLEEDVGFSAPLTRTGVRIMTPEYASPEQVRGENVTTASDVYALGLILYELLTGRRPFAGEARSGVELERLILEQDPERPSTAVARTTRLRSRSGSPIPALPVKISAARGTTPDKLRRRLRGDLDTILLKALRREPDRRYASAEALLDDIERHRAGLPVNARRDSRTYRMAKFLRRNAAGVAVAGVILLLIISYAVTVTIQANRIADERNKAQEVSAFLESLFDAPDPFSTTTDRIDTLRVRDFVERGRHRVQDELVGQPLVQAQMLGVLGNAYRRMGMYEDAVPLLEQAVDIRRELLGTTHLDVAQSLYDLAQAKTNTGDYEPAERLHREALTVRREKLGEEHQDVAASMNALGWVVKETGRLDEAEQLLRNALAIQRARVETDHEAVAATLSLLAGTLTDRGRYDEAEPLFRESLTLRRRHYSDEHPSVAVGLNNLALLLRDRGRYGEAETLLREALAINRASLGGTHPHVADNLNVLGSVLRQKGDLDAAERVLRDAVDLSRSAYGDDHPNVSIKLDTYAALLRAKGDLDGAERAESEAVSIARNAFGNEHFSVAVTTSKLAGILHEKGDSERATSLYREALALMQQLLAEDDLYLVTTRVAYAGCLYDLGRYSQAESLLLESFRTLQNTQGDESRYTQNALRRIIALYEAWGKPSTAAEYRALLPRDA